MEKKNISVWIKLRQRALYRSRNIKTGLQALPLLSPKGNDLSNLQFAPFSEAGKELIRIKLIHSSMLINTNE